MKRKNAIGFSKTNWNSIIKLNAINTKRSDGGLMIPTKQAKSMVSMIPDSFFNDSSDYIKNGVFDKDAYADNHRIIDVCCNSGVLLEICYNKFMMELSLANTSYFESNADVEDYVLQELLFAFVLDIRLCKMLRERFYHSKDCVGNIFSYNIISGKGSDASLITILDNSIAFGDKVLKFDVVCGNPPYNNDMYIDFVLLGHSLAKKYDIWITPAKFWAKSTCDKDEEFRDMIRSSGDSFVVYKNCKDIFDISEPGGIAYYLLNKNNKKSGYKIKCVHKNSVAFQSDFETHDSLDFLPLHTLNILNKLGKSDFKNTLNLLENMYINRITPDDTGNVTIMQGKNVYGYVNKDDLKTLENLDMYKCIQNCICGSGSFQADENGAFLGMPPVYVLEPNEIGKGSFHHLRFFNTASEASHFVEYMSTKLVNFAYICGLCGTTNNAEFYRYIPNPGSFDKFYEDRPLDGYTPDTNGEYIDKDGVRHCSLYIKYKLTEDEINVIESVIRERK